MLSSKNINTLLYSPVEKKIINKEYLLADELKKKSSAIIF